ncbi:hypothetical protein BDW22DRAFT_1422038, partial [Trametopsis cervina]
MTRRKTRKTKMRTKRTRTVTKKWLRRNPSTRSTPPSSSPAAPVAFASTTPPPRPSKRPATAPTRPTPTMTKRRFPSLPTTLPCTTIRRRRTFAHTASAPHTKRIHPHFCNVLLFFLNGYQRLSVLHESLKSECTSRNCEMIP